MGADLHMNPPQDYDRLTMPRRPVQLTEPRGILTMIRGGQCDDFLAEITEVVTERQKNRRQKVLEDLREVYGDAAVHAVVEATAERGGLDV
jgi:hypothetical protein